MPKKIDTVPAKIIPLNQTAENSTVAIARMIQGLVEKVLSGADLQPFFGTAEVSYEIKRSQTVHEQSKFSFYFQDWGCMICGSREAGHCSCGMCQRCYRRVRMRLAASMRKRQPAETSSRENFRDAVKLAREALAPSIALLSPTEKLKDEPASRPRRPRRS
jgi:hypothetical protein